MFGDVAFDAAADYDDSEPVAAQLAALGALVDQGKVRAIGLSNETPWGLLKFLAAAEAAHFPRICSLQNAYSLTCRTFEASLATRFVHTATDTQPCRRAWRNAVTVRVSAWWHIARLQWRA